MKMIVCNTIFIEKSFNRLSRVMNGRGRVRLARLTLKETLSRDRIQTFVQK
jgi:hypothetical protein